MNILKTFILLTAITVLFGVIALILAAMMNIEGWWFSDKIMLYLYRAKQVHSGPMHNTVAVMILAPLAVSLVQMAISRRREYSANRNHAKICSNPLAPVLYCRNWKDLILCCRKRTVARVNLQYK